METNNDFYQMTLDEMMIVEQLQQEFANIEPRESIGVHEAMSFIVEASESYASILKQMYLENYRLYAYSHSKAPVISEGVWQISNVQNRHDNVILGVINWIINLINRVLSFLASIWKMFVKKMDVTTIDNRSFLNRFMKQLMLLDTTQFDGWSFYKLEEKEPIPYSVITPQSMEAYLTHPTGDVLNDNGKKLTDEDIEQLKMQIFTNIYKINVNENHTGDDNSLSFAKAYFYGHKSVQEYSIPEQIMILQNTDKAKARVSKLFKATSIQLKTAEVCMNKLKSTSGTVSAYNFNGYLKLVKFNYDVLNIAFTVYLSALADRAAQAKMICAKALFKREDAQVLAKQEEAAALESNLNSGSIDQLIYDQSHMI